MAQFCYGLWNLYIIFHQLVQCSLFGSMALLAWFQQKWWFTTYRKNNYLGHGAVNVWYSDKKETQLVSAKDIATQFKWGCKGQSGELPWAHYGKPKYKHSWGQMTSPWHHMDVIRSIITRPLAWFPWQQIPQGIWRDIKGTYTENFVLKSSKHIHKITGNMM